MLDLKRLSEHSGLRPDTSSLVYLVHLTYSVELSGALLSNYFQISCV